MNISFISFGGNTLLIIMQPQKAYHSLFSILDKLFILVHNNDGSFFNTCLSKVDIFPNV